MYLVLGSSINKATGKKKKKQLYTQVVLSHAFFFGYESNKMNHAKGINIYIKIYICIYIDAFFF
jgi:hypothetical protein